MVSSSSMLSVGIDTQLAREQQTFTAISSSGRFYKIPTKEAIREMSTPTEDDFFSSDEVDIKKRMTWLTQKVEQIVAVKITLIGELFTVSDLFNQMLKKWRVKHIVLSPSHFHDDLTFRQMLSVVDPKLTTLIVTRPIFEELFRKKNSNDKLMIQWVTKIRSRYNLRGIIVETITDVSMNALICIGSKPPCWEKLPPHLASSHKSKGESLLATRVAAFLATGERTLLEAYKLAKVHHSGILQSVPLSITDMVWNHILPRYEVLKQHKIVRGIADGTINSGLFDFFKEVDGFALQYLDSIFLMLAAQSPFCEGRQKEKEFFINRGQYFTEKFRNKEKFIPPPSKKYEKNLISIVQNSDYFGGLVEIYTCYLVYNKLALEIRKEKGCKKEWVEKNTNSNTTSTLACIQKILNRKHKSPLEIQKLLDQAESAILMERLFFDLVNEHWLEKIIEERGLQMEAPKSGIETDILGSDPIIKGSRISKVRIAQHLNTTYDVGTKPEWIQIQDNKQSKIELITRFGLYNISYEMRKGTTAKVRLFVVPEKLRNSRHDNRQSQSQQLHYMPY